MPRDYAQRSRGGSARHARPRSGGGGGGSGARGGMPGWIWLVAGLSVGLAVAAFVYISRPAPPPPGPSQTAVARPAGSGGSQRNGPIPIPPKGKQRFTFYEILRNQEVVIPKEESRSSTPPPPITKDAAPDGNGGSDAYIIQVASFRSPTEADRQKAQLALIGIESKIESVTIDKKDTYYRVRIGPERNWQTVQSTLARLDDNGIDAMLIRLK